jgi:hypothetical protein
MKSVTQNGGGSREGRILDLSNYLPNRSLLNQTCGEGKERGVQRDLQFLYYKIPPPYSPCLLTHVTEHPEMLCELIVLDITWLAGILHIWVSINTLS